MNLDEPVPQKLFFKIAQCAGHHNFSTIFEVKGGIV